MSKLLLALSCFAIVTVAQAQTPTTTPTPCACTEVETLKKTISQLTTDMQQLRTRMKSMEKELLVTVIQNQLTREEIRGEVLHSRLADIADQEAVLKAQLDDINAQLQPGRIESSLAGVGSVHPEELREGVRARLLNERQRIQYRLNLLQADRTRSQQSLGNNEISIRRLKLKLDDALQK